jgi:hypothetical protein
MVAETKRRLQFLEGEALSRCVELACFQARNIRHIAPFGLSHFPRGSDLYGTVQKPEKLRGGDAWYFVVQPLGACVAKTRPSPYLRACDASVRVLSVHAVIVPDGASVCASSITNRPPKGLSPAGFFFIQANSAICSWLTKLCL